MIQNSKTFKGFTRLSCKVKRRVSNGNIEIEFYFTVVSTDKSKDHYLSVESVCKKRWQGRTCGRESVAGFHPLKSVYRTIEKDGKIHIFRYDQNQIVIDNNWRNVVDVRERACVCVILCARRLLSGGHG